MSEKMRIVIVDDEPLARRGLVIRLNERDDIHIVAECENGRQALDAIFAHDPDIVLLDIQMPGIDGLEVVKALQGDHMPLIVFVTAYDHYAVEAFEVQALDYILKPVDPVRFNATLDRCKKRLHALETIDQKETLLQLALSNKHRSDKPSRSHQCEAGLLKIKDGKNFYRIKWESIHWIDSAGDYVCIHTPTENLIIHSNLKKLEQLLPAHLFVRVHRSTLINTAHIENIKPLTNGRYVLKLHCGSSIHSGRTFKDTVRQLIA